MIKLFGVNWKTSVSGLLTFVMVTCGSVASYLAVVGKTPVTTDILGACTLISGLCHVWVGLISVDAGQVVIPGATPGAPMIAAPSHETPNDPTAKPVVPQPK